MQFLKFRLLEEQTGIYHFITSRRGGISEGRYASLNLSLKVNDDLLHVTKNHSLLAETLGIASGKIFFPDQCHTDRVKEITESSTPAYLESTDGLVTCVRGVCLCVLAADCVPVLLYDPVERVVAALHAGWRGTYEQIVSKAIERMVQTRGCKPDRILACIGPAISQEHYEVGDEVSAYFRLLFSDHPEIVKRNPETNNDHIDLKKANHILLQRGGVKEDHIEISELCTYSHPELFFSARRDGADSGRFATGIMLC